MTAYLGIGRATRFRPAAAALAALAVVALHAPLAAAQTTHGALPTPESVIGFNPGADYKLFTYDQSITYFKALAAAAPTRVKLITVGKTAYGKTWYAAVISSPANLANLAKLRENNMRLAHPEGLTDAEAHRLAAQGRVFVDISGGLHASEIAGSQHTPLVAYDLLSRATEPNMKAVLDSVVFFLWPSINPDGQDIVVNWCRANEGDADHSTGRGAVPMELYEKYVGHDNNRDSYMLNVQESRVIQRTWREWEPDIIYVQHQSSPFPTRIWIPPFADPVGLRVPPIMAREVNAIGTRIAEELDAHGQPGAVSQLETYDAWYPGYIDYMPMYQNIPSWWTETQGGNCAVPRTSTMADLPANYRDLYPTSLYSSPWAEGTWHLRDAMDYMVTADLATLNYAAKFKDEVLYNRYQAARNTIAQFSKSAPYAYVIPQAQHDPMAPVELLRRLAFMGVRIDRLGRETSYDGASYPAGTWVIPMDQEYAQLVRELFEPQKYPVGGFDDTPYDAAGWTIPYQMDVNVVEGKSPLTPEFRAALEPIKGTPVDWHTHPDEPFATNAEAAGIMPAAGGLTGSGDQILLDPAQNNSFKIIARALAAGGATVRFAPAATGGHYILSGVDPARVDEWAKELGVRAERVSAASAPASVTASTRIALYKSSPGVMDEGWTEWLFDTYGYKYSLITPADIDAGDLGAKYDAIIVGSQGIGGRGGRGGRGGARGGRGGGAPPAVDSAAQKEIRAFDEFVRGGGTIVAWNGGAASVATALQLPVRNVVAGLDRKTFFTGGSILQTIVDQAHPVMAGMPANADVMVFNSPVFTTTDGFEGSVMAKYPADASPLRSGFLTGPQFVQGFAAALDVKHDQGHVVLFAFQPEWRGQPTGTFRTVFNASLFSRASAEQAKGTPGFWTPPPMPATPVGEAGGRGGRGGGAPPDR